MKRKACSDAGFFVRTVFEREGKSWARLRTMLVWQLQKTESGFSVTALTVGDDVGGEGVVNPPVRLARI
jgi:hypothetical protein